MKLARIVTWVSEAYPLAALFAYMAVFGIAFLMMFIFPPGSIVLFLGALFLLLPVVLVGKALTLVAARVR